jgi:membrane fusion protein (multidrug efflux system)
MLPPMRWIHLVALLTALSAAGCGEKKAEPAPPLKTVVVAEVVARDVEERIGATGELLPKNRAEVASQIAGEVTSILRDEGDVVPSGTVVLEIDPERRQLELAQAEAGVEEARAALRHAERDLGRIGALERGKIVSRADSDQATMAAETAKSRLDAAVAGLGVAERALLDASVTTRFDGIIARRFVSAGEYVQPGQPLFELVALDPVEVEFHVAEVDSGRVVLGQKLDVTVAPFPDETFEATVSVVSPTIDARTRTLRVKALLPNPDGRLRPGLFARADLGVARRQGVPMVPEEALLQRVDGAVVFRIRDGDRAERLVVQSGPIRGGWAEITEILEPGDQVILRGHSNLVDGAVVAIRNPDGSQIAR